LDGAKTGPFDYLVDSIAEAGGDIAAALKRYERMQLPFGKALVALNREEGAYLSAQIKPKAERRGAELHRDLGAVLHAHIADRPSRYLLTGRDRKAPQCPSVMRQ
jgi:hypothetical protein